MIPQSKPALSYDRDHGKSALTIRARSPARIAVFLGCLVAVQPGNSQVQTRGAKVTDRLVTVDSRSYWAHWTMPSHAVESADDAVVPRYFRDRFNLLEDFRTFRRSID